MNRRNLLRSVAAIAAGFAIGVPKLTTSQTHATAVTVAPSMLDWVPNELFKRIYNRINGYVLTPGDTMTFAMSNGNDYIFNRIQYNEFKDRLIKKSEGGCVQWSNVEEKLLTEWIDFR
jgi:hypothetical protein